MTKGQFYNLLWTILLVLIAITATILVLVWSLTASLVGCIWIICSVILLIVYEPSPNQRDKKLFHTD